MVDWHEFLSVVSMSVSESENGMRCEIRKSFHNSFRSLILCPLLVMRSETTVPLNPHPYTTTNLTWFWIRMLSLKFHSVTEVCYHHTKQCFSTTLRSLFSTPRYNSTKESWRKTAAVVFLSSIQLKEQHLQCTAVHPRTCVFTKIFRDTIVTLL